MASKVSMSTNVISSVALLGSLAEAKPSRWEPVGGALAFDKHHSDAIYQKRDLKQLFSPAATAGRIHVCIDPTSKFVTFNARRYG